MEKKGTVPLEKRGKVTYHSKILSRFPRLINGGFYDQKIAPMQFGLAKNKEEAMASRQRWAKKMSVELKNLVLQEQSHTANIKIVSAKNQGVGVFSPKTAIKNNDGLLTRASKVFLGIFSSDCVPVLFYDPVLKICGAAHCGWRGTLNLLTEKMVKKFVRMGSHPRDIICYLGPSIGRCCYDISQAKDDRREKFRKKFGQKVFSKKGKKINLDLAACLLIQLKRCGIKDRNIEVSGICTSCSKFNLPSYYRDKRKDKSLLTVIGRIN